MNKNQFEFELLAKCKSTHARAGRLHTPHGVINTPVFMPVGTQGSVKALTPEMLTACDVEVILSNTYHLSIRPGGNLIAGFDGLHDFMNWKKPILTDSGGFQVFSLSKSCRVHESGVSFQSHIDGSRLEFNPKMVIDLQRQFNSDIMMPLDICTAFPASQKKVAADLVKTHQWQKIAYEYWQESPNNQWLFAIVQGGVYPSLRNESVSYLRQFNFPGYAIGGVSVGEPFDDMKAVLRPTLAGLPESKPRYVMGIGLPENLEYAIQHGADMFDCVLPTRLARHGQVFMGKNRVNIKRAEFTLDQSPIDKTCRCYTCQHYSRAYLRHLFISGELLSHTLLSIHNIYYLVHFVKSIRRNILGSYYGD